MAWNTSIGYGCTPGTSGNTSTGDGVSYGCGCWNPHFSEDVSVGGNVPYSGCEDHFYHKPMQENNKKMEENIPFDNHGSSYYSVSISDNKEEEDMSFVGITVHGNQAVAYGDCRSSRDLSNGVLGLDTEREGVQKVFRSKNGFLLVTSGTNEFVELDGVQTKVTHVSDWVSGHVDLFATPLELTDCFAKYVKERCVEEFGAIHFSAISPCVCTCRAVKARRWNYLDANVELNAYSRTEKTFIATNGYYAFYGGADMYRWFFDHNQQMLYADADTIRKNIEKSISLMDGVLEYNPVGLPVQVEVLEM